MKRLLILVAGFCLALSGCKVTGDYIIYDKTPQRNDFNIIVNKEKLSKDLPLLVILEVSKISAKSHYKWKTVYIPPTFQRIGIENYEIYDTTLDSLPDTTGKYVMKISVPSWSVKKRKAIDLWVETNVTISDPKGEVIVKIVGDAKDEKKFTKYSIGQMVSNLLTDMLNEYYQGT